MVEVVIGMVEIVVEVIDEVVVVEGVVKRAIIRKELGTQFFMYLLFNDSLMTLFLCSYRCMGIGKWISKSERGFFFWAH